MKKEPSIEEVNELEKYLGKGLSKETRKVKIIFDGKQTNIRIPSDFVEILEVDPDKDLFEFCVEIPMDEKIKPKLTGRLIKNAKEEE